MIWPFWQNPHCGTCSSIQACWIGCSRPFAARPSSVVISPFTEDAGTRQDGTAAPLMITLQAPHCPRPHPNRGPWSPRSLRRTYSKGVAESTSTECDRPLTFSSILLIGPCSLFSGGSCARVNRSARRDQYQQYSGERSVPAGQRQPLEGRTFPRSKRAVRQLCEVPARASLDDRERGPYRRGACNGSEASTSWSSAAAFESRLVDSTATRFGSC